ncbi:polysaccharide pyruvyl transferase family protein [Glutamicibacter arilaitensis]|uniref:polysaccharide pyruvyl transferase family protein n=1 Tax=Glutamicibacter arilaitensis TaxID=256701 RepID=UPI00384FD029
MIGVTGILNSLPLNFPTEFPENSGNMLHGDVPFRMFNESYLAINRNWPNYKSGDRFKDFVNNSCTHVIITCANMFRANDSSPSMRARYKKLEEMLSGYDKPVVLFGLGVQAKEQKLDGLEFPPEAISAMQAIADRAHAVSVRGEFTKSVLEKFGNAKNVFVTGCPSFFSVPSAFKELHENVNSFKGKSKLRSAFSGTYYNRESEMSLMTDVIRSRTYLIEPQNKENYEFYKSVVDNPGLAKVPGHFEYLVDGNNPIIQREELVSYFSNRFKLFRDLKPWDEFNREFIDFTYGTRFHVNMSSLLSGKPALWLTHDSRTRELADTLCLPNLDLVQAGRMSQVEIIESVNYDPLFENLDFMFDRFNEFLIAAELPIISKIGLP